MRIRIGYDITYICPRPTPMILTLNVHPSRARDLETPDYPTVYPMVPHSTYVDGFGNVCTRIVAPKGPIRFRADTVVHDSGLPDPYDCSAALHSIHELPEETLVYLLGSRYCETDRLSQIAWNLFGQLPENGFTRVQAICDFVHKHLTFGYKYARSTRSAYEAYNERVGVCRDFAHLAVALTRCMNIPARYCTGYLGDIGVPVDPDPMDFSGWFEAYIGGQWVTFDARHNTPRIGRVLIARGRDASDVAISTSYGQAWLSHFQVWTMEIPKGEVTVPIPAQPVFGRPAV